MADHSFGIRRIEERILARSSRRDAYTEGYLATFATEPLHSLRLNLFVVSRELWSLTIDEEDFSHEFIQLRQGVQLHYLCAPTSGASNDLVIFLHGFPDTAYLFSRQLRSDLAYRAKLVALDLPGCGGSDSLESYGPDQVLNVVAEAIVQLKAQYLVSKPSGRCIFVCHDWGGIVGLRLAAETRGLVDHVVAVNSLYVSQPRSRTDQATVLI